MKKVYVSSLGLPKGFPIQEYENLAEVIKDGGDQLVDYPEKGQKMDRATVVINQLLHQKDGLVQGRTELALYIEYVFKFPWRTKQVTKKQDGKDVTVTEYLETEGKYIDRFVVAGVDGKYNIGPVSAKGETDPKNDVPYTIPGITLTKNAEQDEAAVMAALQAIIDKPFPAVDDKGATVTTDTTAPDGKVTKTPVLWFDLRNDIKQPVRVSVAKKPWVTATAAATNIIANKSQAKWAATFKKEGVPFEPFDTGNAESDKLALAWAIQARESRRAVKEYA